MTNEVSALKELEGLKEEMRALADHLEILDVDLDSDVVADVLSELADGKTAEYLIAHYGIVEESGV